MDQDQANLIMDAMARTAIATQACFNIIADRPEELTAEQLVAIEEYAVAKVGFDTALRTALPGAAGA